MATAANVAEPASHGSRHRISPACTADAPMLPGEGPFRSLMRAAENSLSRSKGGEQHPSPTHCQASSRRRSSLARRRRVWLLGAASAKNSSGWGGSGGSSSRDLLEGGATARELLRDALDHLSLGRQSLVESYFDEEASSIKRALSGLAADLDAVHEQEGRRARVALAHIKAQFDVRLDTVRRACQEQHHQAIAELKRECEGKVAAAERARIEAEPSQPLPSTRIRPSTPRPGAARWLRSA